MRRGLCVSLCPMKVALRNPDRELDVAGGRLVREVLAELAIDPDTVLVIRDGELITRHERVTNDDRREIDYVVEECPLVAGNTQLRNKEAMNAIEARSPGTKAQLFLGYLDRGMPTFRTAKQQVDLLACERCGQPTTGTFCAFCRARAQILGEGLTSAAAEA